MSCKAGWICNRCGSTTAAIEHAESRHYRLAKRYPQNPGAKMLPTQLVNVQNFKPASTSKIALLLPLNGQAAVFSAPFSKV
ncbi:MAG: penicillin-binding protein activator [Enterobacter hormaechei]